MNSFPYDNMGAPSYRNDQFATPVKDHPPSFGYGNSSSPAYDSPPTVGRSSSGNIDWTTSRFSHNKSATAKAHLLPSQVPPNQYPALESSPPEPTRGIASDIHPNEIAGLNESLFREAATPHAMRSAMHHPSNEPFVPQMSQHNMRRQDLNMQQQQRTEFQAHQQMLQQQARIRQTQRSGYEFSPLYGKRNRSVSHDMNFSKRFQLDPGHHNHRALHRASSSASLASSGSSPSPTSAAYNHFRHASVTGAYEDMQYAQRNAALDRRLSVPVQHVPLSTPQAAPSHRRSNKKKTGSDSRNEKQRITQHLINQDRLAKGELGSIRRVHPPAHQSPLNRAANRPLHHSGIPYGADRQQFNFKASPSPNAKVNSAGISDVSLKQSPHGNLGGDLLPNEDMSPEGLSNFLNSDGIQDLLSDDYNYDESPTAYEPFSDASVGTVLHSGDTTLQGGITPQHEDSSDDLISPVSRLQPPFLPQNTSTPKSSRLISSPFGKENVGNGGPGFSAITEPMILSTSKKGTKSRKHRSKQDGIKPSTQATPSRVAPLPLRNNSASTDLPSPATPSTSSWSGKNNFSLYTENGTNNGRVLSSKAFALACEKQNSLRDPKANIFKGDLEYYELSKRHFTGKSGLQFSINHSGRVSVDALTPPLEKSTDKEGSSTSGEDYFSSHLAGGTDASTLVDDPSLGFTIAQKFFSDESDSESETEHTPKVLQTPPRFSSLGNTDATTAFARTLSRAREGKGSTFLFPVENTPDKHAQLSSYAPSTPRAPATFQDTSFSMQTPPGAICNYENGDFYGTGMTPYFSTNLNS